MPSILLAIALLIAWMVLAAAMAVTAPAVHVLLAASATLFVHGWALTR
jgi:hypothetical protein